jgi:hypothetical protein
MRRKDLDFNLRYSQAIRKSLKMNQEDGVRCQPVEAKTSTDRTQPRHDFIVSQVSPLPHLVEKITSRHGLQDYRVCRVFRYFQRDKFLLSRILDLVMLLVQMHLRIIASHAKREYITPYESSSHVPKILRGLQNGITRRRRRRRRRRRKEKKIKHIASSPLWW